MRLLLMLYLVTDPPHPPGFAVDTTHHLIITHEWLTSGPTVRSSRPWPSRPRRRAENLDAIADRGYFSSDRENAGITVTLPKPMTSGIIAKGRFGKQDFRYVAEEDIYI